MYNYHKDERYSSYPIDFKLTVFEYLYEIIGDYIDADKYDEIEDFIRDLKKKAKKLALHKDIKEIQKCYALEISKYVRELVSKEKTAIEADIYDYCYKKFEEEYEMMRLADSRL